MQFKCENCKRLFEFDDFISFCPYCGNKLSASASKKQDIGADTSDLIQTIDSIWGENARLRKEFSETIKRSICLINDCIDARFEKVLPKQGISKFDKNYASIKQSNNRKTLITRLNSYLDYLDEIIDSFSDRIPADTSSRLEAAAHEIDDLKKELYDFLGLRYTASTIDFASDNGFSAEILYTREQLRDLYDLVLIAFAKYKKCVEDNNMFAAFASTSDYGVIKDSFRRWLYRTQEDESEKQEPDDPQYEQIVAYMKSHNSIKYYGLLDEDFVPHVDAFWYGLKMLCECIDHHIAFDCSIESLYIDDTERAKIMRFISSTAFEVNDSRIENAIELRERFEKELTQ